MEPYEAFRLERTTRGQNPALLRLRPEGLGLGLGLKVSVLQPEKPTQEAELRSNRSVFMLPQGVQSRAQFWPPFRHATRNLGPK